MNNREINEEYVIPLPIILEAMQNDPEALIFILNHFDKYMNRLCLKETRDASGNTYHVLDEDMKQQLQIKLVVAIPKFKIH